MMSVCRAARGRVFSVMENYRRAWMDGVMFRRLGLERGERKEGGGKLRVRGWYGKGEVSR